MSISDIGYVFYLLNTYENIHNIDTTDKHTFIIVNSNYDRDDCIHIPSAMIKNRDQALTSILLNMNMYPILKVDNALDQECIPILITQLLGEKYATIIHMPMKIVNTLSREFKHKNILKLRSIQYNMGDTINSVYKITKYMLSNVDWEDESLVWLQIGNTNKYRIINVNRMYGYNFDRESLEETLSILGRRMHTSYDILIE